MKISYAQNLEDILLSRAFENVNEGFYVDLGAAWPEFHSVTKYFYDIGWSGINVEPNKEFYDLLKSARKRDINLPFAISSKMGESNFTVFENTGLSTGSENVIARHLDAGWIPKVALVEFKTLLHVLDVYLPLKQEIHFLKIDVEGMERDVIESNDWNKYRPWVILIEAIEPLTSISNSESWEPLLISYGYKLVFNDGVNKYFVAEEHHELEKFFEYGVNCLDNYVLYEQVRLQEELLNSREINAKFQDELKFANSEVKNLQKISLELSDKLANLDEFYSLYGFLDINWVNKLVALVRASRR